MLAVFIFVFYRVTEQRNAPIAESLCESIDEESSAFPASPELMTIHADRGEGDGEGVEVYKLDRNNELALESGFIPQKLRVSA